jgi:branched-chain amino acid transport system permease protein
VNAAVASIIDTVRSLGWSGAFDLFKNGIVVGSLYALIALGYTMVYGILKLLNFAHGDIYMVGGLIGYGVLTSLGGPLHPVMGVVPLLIVVFLCAMVASGGLGIVVERFAYRPLRNAPRIAPLISALGVAFFLENSVLLLTGGNRYSYGTVFLGAPKNLLTFGPLLNPVFHVAGVPVTEVQLLVVSTCLFLMIVLTLVVSRTRLGKAMRATAYDREAASMMGIDTDRVISATFFIASVLAGAAGVMFGLYELGPEIYYFIGFLAGLKAFTAAVVGGIGSIPGAMAGGLLIGLVEQFSIGYVGGQWSDIVVFGILILFMLVRPSGLFGAAPLQKV